MNDGIRQPTVTAPVTQPARVAQAIPSSAAGSGPQPHFRASPR